MKLLKHVAAVLAFSLAAAACSNVQTVPTNLRTDLIDVAVKALEAKLGSAQKYFEINATPTLVNLFVANRDATQATSFVFAAGELGEPSLSEAASGPTFAASDISFERGKVLSHVAQELPKVTMRVFAVVGQVGGGVHYVVSVQSELGGTLDVPVRGDGTIIPAGG